MTSYLIVCLPWALTMPKSSEATSHGHYLRILRLKTCALDGKLRLTFFSHIVNATHSVVIETGQRVESSDERLKRIEKHDKDAETRQMLDWIASSHFTADPKNFLERKQEGTGRWFVESDDFQGWLEDGRKALICQGMPGAGLHV